MKKRAWSKTKSGVLVPRREVIRGGLATFASVMMSKLLPGCDSAPMTDAGMDAGPMTDGGMPMTDAGMHPGFPMRNVPPAPNLRSLIADIGPLSATPDANGVRLPAGFTSRVIAHSGDMVAGTTYSWHAAPDGAATFRTEDGGWILVVNSEVPVVGGASAVRFADDGTIMSAYRVLMRTNTNCAGGPTPWHTWLSCEEMPTGRVWECDPWGEVPAIARLALGVFHHEAVTVDPVNARLYLTEDRPDGRFYRFTPDMTTPEGNPVLESGTLEVAAVNADMSVTWMEVPDPQMTGSTPTRMQVPASTAFDGGEGIWWHAGVIYFSTKGDSHIWAYDTAAETISILYDGSMLADPVLSGVDNITVSCCGDVLVAEDGGSMEVVAILPDGTLVPLLQVPNQDSSEITGPAFDPSGTRLYFSSQRSPEGGTTFEVTGPFHEPA